MTDGTKRCEICDWPLATRIEDGCVPGNCSYRPKEGSDEHRRIRERRESLARGEDPRAGDVRVLGQPATRLTPPAEVLAAAEALNDAIARMEPCECAVSSGCPRAAAKVRVLALLEQWRGAGWLGR